MRIDDIFSCLALPRDQRVQVQPQLSSAALSRVAKAYQVSLEAADLVCLIDETLFGSAAHGCVMTRDAIGLRAAFEPPVWTPYDDVEWLQLEGRELLIRAYGRHAHYRFRRADAGLLGHVFGALQAFLATRSEPVPDFDVTLAQAQSKLQEAERIFESLVHALGGATPQDGPSARRSAEFDACFDDLSRLRERVARRTITRDECQYLARVHGLLLGWQRLQNDPATASFDPALCQPTSTRGALHAFLCGFMGALHEHHTQRATAAQRG